MIRKPALTFTLAPAVVVVATTLFATFANGSPIYNFETLNNDGDPAFNQLLGINSLASPTVVGYFGDGTIEPNKGYSLVQPYNSQGSYTNENFPGSVQTQVVGITPLGSATTVGFYIDNSGNNIGFVDQSGTFTGVSDPSTPTTTPSTNQLLGVNDNGQAVGFYVDGDGNNQAYLYNITTKSFTAINLPGSFDAMSTTATGINDAGVVSGFYTNTGGATLGFIDNAGTFTSYNDPFGSNTMFLGINASDEVVGSFLNGSSVTEGLLFNVGTDTFQTIDDPLASSTPAFGVTGTTINGINNAGDLVGFYSDGTNVNGLLATPTPEPTMIWLLMVGVALMIGKSAARRTGSGLF
jgi:hypothetical protein